MSLSVRPKIPTFLELKIFTSYFKLITLKPMKLSKRAMCFLGALGLWTPSHGTDTSHLALGHRPINLDSYSSLGLHSLSLLKNRTCSLNASWSDVVMVAHEPYLVTADKAALVLWNRKTLEPFSTLKEPHIKKMIILAENQKVPGESFFVGPSPMFSRVNS